MSIIIYIVNLFLAALIFYYESNSNSDKTFVISASLYLLLIGFNFLMAFVFYLDKKSFYEHFFYCAVLLIMLAMIQYVRS